MLCSGHKAVITCIRSQHFYHRQGYRYFHLYSQRHYRKVVIADFWPHGEILPVLHDLNDKMITDFKNVFGWKSQLVRTPHCIAPSRVTQKIFAVLVDWVHHVVLTPNFKLVSFYIYICRFTVVSIGQCVICKLTYNNFVFIFPNFRYRGYWGWF